MVNWYMKGQSNYDSSSGFHMGLFFDMNGFPEGNYDSIKMPDDVLEGDPFMAVGVETKPTWTPANAVVEFGLWDHYRIKINSSGIQGWNEATSSWSNLLTENRNLNDLADVNAGSPNDDDVLSWDVATGKWIPVVPGGAGEVNTGSNQGTDGVGVYDTKVGVDLQFRHIAPASSKISTVLNVKDIDIDVVENQINHNSLAGLNAGDVYEHISAAQLAALHTIYSLEVHDNTHHNPNYKADFSENTAFNKNFGSLGTEVCVGNDARLSDARTPTTHVLATTGPHTGTLPWGDLNKTGSSLAHLVTRTHANLSDAPADAHHPQAHTLASHSTKAHSELSDAPENAHHNKQHAMDDITQHTRADNAVLNASTSFHGFLKKLDNVATHYINGQGNWATPPGGGPTITQSSGAPTITPAAVADIYINTDNLKIWMAAATAGAWSWGYTGQASTSSFTKDTIANMVAWWMAGAGITKDGSDLVSQWSDQSDGGNHLLQTTAAYQPLWVDNLFGGYPAVRFDGINDWMTKQFTLNQPATYFLVLRVLTGSANDFWIDGWNLSRMIIYEIAGNIVQIYAGTGLNGGAFADTVKYIWTAVFNGVSSSIQRNDGAPTTGNAGDLDAGGIVIGGRRTVENLAHIEVAEVLIYNTNLSVANQNIVRTYLNNKYGIW